MFFVIEFGSYICTRMPFGLSSSGIIFNQVTDRVLGELKSKCSIPYENNVYLSKLKVNFSPIKFTFWP